MAKARVAFYHYNRPASLKRGKPQISVHQAGVCHVVDGLICKVPMNSRIRENRQPKFVMAGKGRLKIHNNIAILY